MVDPSSENDDYIAPGIDIRETTTRRIYTVLDHDLKEAEIVLWSFFEY